jgi:hypothetical protein
MRYAHWPRASGLLSRLRPTRHRARVLLRFIVVGELLLKVMDTGAAIQERGVG